MFKKSLSLKIGVAIAVVMLISMTVNISVILDRSYDREIQSIGEKIAQLESLLEKSLRLAMQEGTDSVEPFIETISQMKNIEEFRVIPGNVVRENSEAKMDNLEKQVFSSHEPQQHEEEFAGEPVIRSIMPVIATDVCTNCHEVKVGEPIAVMSIRYSTRDVKEAISSNIWISVILTLTVLVLSYFLIMFLIRKQIVNRLFSLIETMKSLAIGDLRSEFSNESEDELGQAVDAITHLQNSLRDRAQTATQISEGNVDGDLKVLSDADELGKAMVAMRTNIAELLTDFRQTTDGWKTGDMAARCQPEKLSGAFSEMLSGVNNVLDTAVESVAQNEKIQREAAARERQQAEYLQKKVDSILEVVSSAARGDLTHEITVSGNDAIGQMGEGLSRFLADLRKNIASIAESADTLSDSSRKLTEMSQQLGGNSEETSTQSSMVASAAEQVSANNQAVAAAIEQMGASIKEISVNSSQAAKISNEAVRVAEETNERIMQLGNSSREIDKVIQVINSIAAQTNLLALNATIEAARAGEAGKGFAVVASEVKDLADETAKATEEISRKISAIQNDVGNSTESITRISEIIANISNISNTIASAIEEQSATTREISLNVNEAARGSLNIAENIAGISAAAQDSAKNANDAIQAAEILQAVSLEMNSLVSAFKYKKKEVVRSEYVMA